MYVAVRGCAQACGGGVRGRMQADAGVCGRMRAYAGVRGRTRAYAYKGRIFVNKGRKKTYDLYTVLSVRGAYAGRTRGVRGVYAGVYAGVRGVYAGGKVCTQNGVACTQRRWHMWGVCGHACAHMCEHTWYKHSAHLVILASWFPIQSKT